MRWWKVNKNPLTLVYVNCKTEAHSQLGKADLGEAKNNISLLTRLTKEGVCRNVSIFSEMALSEKQYGPTNIH